MSLQSSVLAASIALMGSVLAISAPAAAKASLDTGALGLASAPAHVVAPAIGAPPPMVLGAATFAPKGYIAFCARRPDQCGLPADLSAQARADLTQTVYQQEWTQVLAVKAPVASAPATEGATGEPMEDYDGFLASTLPDEGDVRQTLAQAVASDTAPANEAAPIVLTSQVWAKLSEVNLSINSRLKPMTDEQAFGWSDYWTLPLTGEGGKGAGNCKHYVLEKRKALVEAGIPAADLSIAIVRTGWGEVHAVLIVATDKGELVLDNLTPAIKGWRQAPYAWLSRQVPGHPAAVGDGERGGAVRGAGRMHLPETEGDG